MICNVTKQAREADCSTSFAAALERAPRGRAWRGNRKKEERTLNKLDNF